MNTEQELQIAKAEALFREVNERIAESAERFEAEEAELVCECSDPHCTHRFEVPLEEYHRARRKPTRFLLAPGHGDDRVEKTVRSRGDYEIVDKVHARIARIVTSLDPRADPA